MRVSLSLLVLFVSLIVLAGCSQPPTEPAADGRPTTELLMDQEAQNRYLQARIAETFPDDPLMAIIAGCESTSYPNRVQHWNSDGSLVANPTSSARGMFQVLFQFHGDWIARTGLDVAHDLDDYLAFTHILYAVQGRGAWYPSEHCWGPHR